MSHAHLPLAQIASRNQRHHLALTHSVPLFASPTLSGLHFACFSLAQTILEHARLRAKCVHSPTLSLLIHWLLSDASSPCLSPCFRTYTSSSSSSSSQERSDRHRSSKCGSAVASFISMFFFFLTLGVPVVPTPPTLVHSSYLHLPAHSSLSCFSSPTRLHYFSSASHTHSPPLLSSPGPVTPSPLLSPSSFILLLLLHFLSSPLLLPSGVGSL